MFEVTMPKLGLTMKEGKVVTWYKKEGERVEKDEPLLAVETEKITNDVGSPVAGIVKKIIAQEDTVVPVTETVALIEEAGVVESADEPEDRGDERKPLGKMKQVVETPSVKNRVSPLALKIAKDHNIDLSEIKGTGLGGMITKNDVLKLVGSTVQVPSEQVPSEIEVTETVEMSLPRRKTAQRLAQMHRETPHVTLTTFIDFTDIVKIRNRLKEMIEKKIGKKLTFTHLIAKAVSMALKEFQDINSRLDENKISRIKDINLGIAVDVEEGLVVPVVKNAGEMSLNELVTRVSELMDKARNKNLALDDITGGTFTISNLGTFGVDAFTPLINPPECAILGIGKILKRAWVVNEQIEIRPIATFSLTFDHRIVDGAQAARFLQRIKEILENPKEDFK
ncbi:MAG: 2-oxo acid dehydrogenase subunit E2 [Spirochaetota bacterium]|nr:MAG: 2-oxo acid dehydrogenase subunit E2 [Spirochaetota bacterium]